MLLVTSDLQALPFQQAVFLPKIMAICLLALHLVACTASTLRMPARLLCQTSNPVPTNAGPCCGLAEGH